MVYDGAYVRLLHGAGATVDMWSAIDEWPRRDEFEVRIDVKSDQRR